jgi:hypothetical protein
LKRIPTSSTTRLLGLPSTVTAVTVVAVSAAVAHSGIPRVHRRRELNSLAPGHARGRSASGQVLCQENKTEQTLHEPNRGPMHRHLLSAVFRIRRRRLIDESTLGDGGRVDPDVKSGFARFRAVLQVISVPAFCAPVSTNLDTSNGGGQPVGGSQATTCCAPPGTMVGGALTCGSASPVAVKKGGSVSSSTARAPVLPSGKNDPKTQALASSRVSRSSSSTRSPACSTPRSRHWRQAAALRRSR